MPSLSADAWLTLTDPLQTYELLRSRRSMPNSGQSSTRNTRDSWRFHDADALGRNSVLLQLAEYFRDCLMFIGAGLAHDHLRHRTV